MGGHEVNKRGKKFMEKTNRSFLAGQNWTETIVNHQLLACQSVTGVAQRGQQ